MIPFRTGLILTLLTTALSAAEPYRLNQPEEIRRVDGLGYSAFNLEAQFQIAHLAAGLGIDLWNYTAPNGASLHRERDFRRPYNPKPQAWPTSQNAKLSPGFLDALIAQAEAGWRNSPSPRSP